MATRTRGDPPGGRWDPHTGPDGTKSERWVWDAPGAATAPLRASEHDEQCALIEICRLHEGRHPALRNLFAVPNGGHRHKAVAAGLAASGVVAGVPDLFLAHLGRFPEPAYLHGRCEYPGLFIELKRVGYAPSDVKLLQHEWHDRLRAAGYAVAVCGGWEQAWAGIRSYLGIAEHVR